MTIVALHCSMREKLIIMANLALQYSMYWIIVSGSSTLLVQLLLRPLHELCVTMLLRMIRVLDQASLVTSPDVLSSTSGELGKT